MQMARWVTGGLRLTRIKMVPRGEARRGDAAGTSAIWARWVVTCRGGMGWWFKDKVNTRRS